MADLEEQLSDEEKVRAAEAAEPVGPGASKAPAYHPGVWLQGKGIGLCPQLPFLPLFSRRPSACPCQSPEAARGGRSLPGLLAALLVGCVLRK